MDDRLAARGLALQDDDRERLARAVSLELQRSVHEHQAYLLGRTEVRPVGSSLSATRLPAAPLTFNAIIEGWLVEKKPNQKTEYT